MKQKLSKIIKSSRLFYLADEHYNRVFRRRLKNHDFTILSPNCMAGLIYHRLGERFNSPTIDISMKPEDFIEFISDLDYYCSQDISEDRNYKLEYPAGIIKGNASHKDINVFFVHYESFEHGRSKWNERKTRIIKDNLFIIMCDIDDIFEADYQKVGYLNDSQLEMFESVECRNKALLTRRILDKSYAYYIEPQYNKLYPLVYLNRGINTLNYFEKKFDFVSFLNE